MTKTEMVEVLRLHLLWTQKNPSGIWANLSGAELSRANLSRADLSGAALHGANLTDADLRGAYLSRANLFGAYLRGADLTGAYLRGADLHGANLSRAYLRGANLLGADLHGADLRGADLHGADLRGANLSGAARGKYIIKREPISVAGAPYPIMIFDEHIEIGCECHSISAWANFADDEISEMDGIKALKFWRQLKPIILGIVQMRTEEEQ